MDIDVDSIRDQLERDSVIRDGLKEENASLEKKVRVLTGLLNKIHSTLPSEGALEASLRQPALDPVL